MGTYTAGSMNYNEACERAEEQIRDDLKAGAIDDYLDSDSAMQILGTIIKMHQSNPWKSDIQIDCQIGIYLQTTIDQIVENNVARVAQENAE